MAERARGTQILRHGILGLAALVVALPFVWMLAVSLAPVGEVFSGTLFPVPSLSAAYENYAFALTRIPLLRFMLNGAVVCAIILLLQLLVAAPAGYALAKLPFRGRELFFSAVLLGLLIPMQVPAIPLYLAIARLGLLDSYTALIAPFAVSVFAIFLFRQFFLSYPDEILDAARLDGFSEFAIVWRLMLPAAKPAVAAFACVSVIAHWNDLYWPLIVITDSNMMTPPVGLTVFRSSNETTGNPGALMAGGVMVTVPLVFAFLFLQRHLIRSFGVGLR